ncbi:Adenosine 5'-monophosphoramidase [Actinomortierella ambigua]|nr:Adenosine 5'-monophosphoramidase [Actinomortierella ambigua]
MATKAVSCIFCKIVKREMPARVLFETEKSIAFLDAFPLSDGHALVIPKQHAVKMHELPDDALADLMPLAKKVANALGSENYNILQNNGRPAHQFVDHVHFHVIPKPNQEEGLIMKWDNKAPSQEHLDAVLEKIKKNVKL